MPFIGGVGPVFFYRPPPLLRSFPRPSIPFLGKRFCILFFSSQRFVYFFESLFFFFGQWTLRPPPSWFIPSSDCCSKTNASILPQKARFLPTFQARFKKFFSFPPVIAVARPPPVVATDFHFFVFSVRSALFVVGAENLSRCTPGLFDSADFLLRREVEGSLLIHETRDFPGGVMLHFVF